MKKQIILILFVLSLVACDSMDSNYIDYLKDIKQYSPRVTNLKAHVPEVRTVVLTWENPIGDTAVKILIDTGNDSYQIDEMINTYRLENLDIKGYTINVYTIDKYGNKSVPATVQTFPNPRE